MLSYCRCYFISLLFTAKLLGFCIFLRCLFFFSLFIFFSLNLLKLDCYPPPLGTFQISSSITFTLTSPLHLHLHFSTETLLLTFLTLLYLRVPSSWLTVPSQGYFFSCFFHITVGFSWNKSFLSPRFVHYPK